MNHRENDPAWLAVVKVVAALALAILALGFGALGACGLIVSVPGMLASFHRGGDPGLRFATLNALFGLGGVGVAGLMVWGIVLMLGRKRDREE